MTGRTQEQHFCTLDEVLNGLEMAGTRLKREKYIFMLPKVEYLGPQRGNSADQREGSCYDQGPKVKVLTELRAFLGLVNYYAKFMRCIHCSGPTVLPAPEQSTMGVEVCPGEGIQQSQSSIEVIKPVDPLQTPTRAHPD